MLSERPSGQGAAQCCGFCLYTVAERADGQGKRRSANTSAESTRLAGHFTPPAARALRDAERIRRRCQQKTAAVVRERREGDQVWEAPARRHHTRQETTPASPLWSRPAVVVPTRKNPRELRMPAVASLQRL